MKDFEVLKPSVEEQITGVLEIAIKNWKWAEDMTELLQSQKTLADEQGKWFLEMELSYDESNAGALLK